MEQEEKLEEAERLYQTANADQRYMLESLFPELKKSEDERIRKELLESFKYQQRESRTDKEWLNGIKLSEVVAWLEKQGEKKPQRMISAEAKEAMYGKPAWSEEDELVVEDAEEAVINYWHGQAQEDILDWLKSLKNRGTWKPSDEQMDTLLSEVTAWTKGCPKQKVLESLYNDLKKLKGE